MFLMTGSPTVPLTVQTPRAPATVLVIDPPGGRKFTFTMNPPDAPSETIVASYGNISVPPFARA
jgi:hypothetical protein